MCPEEEENVGSSPPVKPQLAPHQERMLAEYTELNDRLNKLRAFIESEKFMALSPEEQMDMGDQSEGMRGYAAALRSRINRFQRGY